MTAQEALNKLKEGNRRYVIGQSSNPTDHINRRMELASGQSPFAIVLSCADSRVVPEMIFDQGMGDLFVIRVAGNIADDRVIGSIEYAVEHLDSKLIVVLGHEKCGAVGASLSDEDPGGHMSSLVQLIKPAVEKAKSIHGDLLMNAVKLNAEMVADQLKSAEPFIASKIRESELQVVSGYYKLSTGEVEFL